MRSVHALGLILPANPELESHLASVQPTDGTVLLVWTEYLPLRRVLNDFRRLGGHALFGTSSNRSGQPTHTSVRDVWSDFFLDVDAVVIDDFSHLPAYRRQSTSIVDLTGARPTLHRPGSVSRGELNEALAAAGLAGLTTQPAPRPAAPSPSVRLLAGASRGRTGR